MPSKVILKTPPESPSPTVIDVEKVLDRLFWELRQLNTRIAQLESKAFGRPRLSVCRERIH